MVGRRLFHIFFDGLAQVFNGLMIPFGGGFDDTVLQVILKDELAGVVDGRSYGGNLHQHFGTVPAVFDHALDGLEMADGPGKPVEHGLGVFVGMVMAVVMMIAGGFGVVMIVVMGDAVGVEIFVIQRLGIGVVFGIQSVHLTDFCLLL